jgi:hypothetical protein
MSCVLCLVMNNNLRYKILWRNEAKQHSGYESGMRWWWLWYKSRTRREEKRLKAKISTLHSTRESSTKQQCKIEEKVMKSDSTNDCVRKKLFYRKIDAEIALSCTRWL